MEYLSVKTRGNSDPSGKPRVYFTCHPDDFENSFDKICDDILKNHDCAVYYTNDMTSPLPEEYRDTVLGRMNLFVVPITFKLLKKPNRAMDSDIVFALEKHIPVLPIMLENDINEYYAEKFGELQYLDPYSRDTTAISYEEKLKKYLSAVLFDDKTAERVRAAFDAYIFLSYRKKDRKYANELMRLIHADPVCRDIAIWYDEFLTPGESFSDNIEKMLGKSDLFTLLVTPNLVNENNYVKTVEYPQARDMGKKILPAEMVDTDKNALKNQYDGIPDIINAHDDLELKKSLSQAFSAYALRENDTDPAHNYLIGLAYLEGIDVEINHERAAELITSSAEAELPEAIEKLIEMYKSGEGVKQDHETALMWHKRLAELNKRRFLQDKTDDNALRMENVFWNLGDYCITLGKLKDANDAYSAMLEMLEYIDTKWKERYVSLCYDSLGNIAKAEQNLALAKEYYEKSFEINKKLADSTGTPDALRDLSLSYDRLGDTAQVEQNIALAKEYYEKSFEINKKLADSTGTPEALRDLSVSYGKLGDIAKAKQNLTLAKEYYEKVLEIFVNLAESTGTPEALSDLSLSYGKLGNISEDEQNLELAKKYYEKSLEIRKKLAESTGTPKALRELSISYNNLGDIAKAEQNLALAKEYYEKGLEISKKLAESTGTPKALRDLSLSYEKLGDIAEAEQNLVKAKEYYEKSLEIRKKLAESTGTAEALRDLSVSYEKLGEIAKAEQNLTLAKEYYEKDLEISKNLAESTGTAQALRNLSVSYEKLGEIAQAEQNFTLAKEYYKKYSEISKKLAESTGTPEALRDLSVSYNKLGNIAKAEQNLTLAKKYYEKDLEISKKLADSTGTPEALRNLSISYNKLGDIAEAEQKLALAKEYYEKGLEIFVNLADSAGTPDALRDLSISYEKLGNIAKAEQNLELAKEYYEKDLEISTKLADSTGTAQAYDDLALSYYKLACISNDKSLFQTAYEIWDSLSSQFPQIHTFGKRRDIVKRVLTERFGG